MTEHKFASAVINPTGAQFRTDDYRNRFARIKHLDSGDHELTIGANEVTHCVIVHGERAGLIEVASLYMDGVDIVELIVDQALVRGE
jgi:hypothetical protein